MDDNLPQLVSALQDAEAILTEMALLIMAGNAAFDSTWERANRICDLFHLPNAAGLGAANQDAGREYQRAP